MRKTPPKYPKKGAGAKGEGRFKFFFFYKNTHSDGRKYHVQYGSDLIRIGQDTYVSAESNFSVLDSTEVENNGIIVEVIGGRKRENGLVVPCLYKYRSNNKKIAEILIKEVSNSSEKYKKNN